MSAEKDYMNWVRQQPCVISGYIGEEVDPSHLEGMSWLTGKSGASKGHFMSCVPMRHCYHRELHRIGHRSFEKKYNISQLELAFATMLKAEKAGVITIKTIK